MTLLGYTDGASHTEGASYLELAEWIIANCDDTDRNLEQLWRRIVFNIAVSNCDDHLRNHGFLLTPQGWRLSPAYDINPDEYGTGLKLNISENDNSLDLIWPMSITPYFGLEPARAEMILAEVKHAVSGWRKLCYEIWYSQVGAGCYGEGVQVLTIKKISAILNIQLHLMPWGDFLSRKFYNLNYRISFVFNIY